MNIRKLTTIAALAAVSLGAWGAECRLRVGFAPIEKGADVPKAIESRLQSRVEKALAANGVSAGDNTSQFFVAARFDNGYEEVLTVGTGSKTVIKTVLTLFMADNVTGQTYAAASFDLKGVGDSKERAYGRCLDGLNGKDAAIVKFADEGRKKIIEYFDANYNNYIQQANTAMKSRNYDDALYYLSCIPECCVGYSKAQAMAVQVWQESTNYDSATLLAKAEAAWAADPTERGADIAAGYLSLIDPSAACKPRADALAKKISQRMQRNWDYENITKAEQEHELNKMRIRAAQAIGEAAAKNRPQTVYKFVYPRGYYY